MFTCVWAYHFSKINLSFFPPLRRDITSSVTRSSPGRDMDTSSQTPITAKEASGTGMYILRVGGFWFNYFETLPKVWSAKNMCFVLSLTSILNIFHFDKRVFTELLSSRVYKLNWNFMLSDRYFYLILKQL